MVVYWGIDKLECLLVGVACVYYRMLEVKVHSVPSMPRVQISETKWYHFPGILVRGQNIRYR